MLDQINNYKKEIEKLKINNTKELEYFRVRFISKKSVINDLFKKFKTVTQKEKGKIGSEINTLKTIAKNKLSEASRQLNNKINLNDNFEDLSLPPLSEDLGSLHPIRIIKNKIMNIFNEIGFSIEDGPEIEKDWYNFTALNFPENHPAREMQDTFFIERDPDVVLRTHTSNVQIRLMEQKKPPLRVIIPGRVYRNETVSSKSHCFFHQVEGLYINEGVSFKDLKDTLYYFAKEMFGNKTKVRFRPSYFPFTEPSAEMDISWKSGWLEILGSGMVDPNVLENCGLDSKKYSGFAFGMGIERIAMLKYQIDDLRLFSKNDIRFLKQFRGAN
jgi:phenylalanyl-tRNA synthetase alpha chain